VIGSKQKVPDGVGIFNAKIRKTEIEFPVMPSEIAPVGGAYDLLFDSDLEFGLEDQLVLP